jgi:hypothetical protein
VPAPRPAGRAAALATACLIIAACGSSPTSPPPASGNVAVVAGTTITAEQLDVRLQSALGDLTQAGAPSGNSQMLTAVTATVIGSLIFDTVVAQEAAKLHLMATAQQVQDRLTQFTQDAGGATQLQSQLAAAGQSVAGLRDEITASINETNVENYFAQVRADEVLQQLAQGVAFDSLVSQYDDSPTSSQQNGKLGPLSAGQVTSELGANVLTALQPLQPGEYTRTAIRDTAGYEILQVDAVTASTWSLTEILVAAPQPYTVNERPQWFAEEVNYQIYSDCQANQITLFGTYAKVKGADPCTAGVGASPSPSAVATGAASPASPASPTASPSG